MFLLDGYLLPVLEVTVSILIPLVLTLKALQLTTIQIDPDYYKNAMTFWLIYWLLFSMLQLANVNFHFKSVFTLYYLGRNQHIINYLLNFYQFTLLPFTTKSILHPLNMRMTEEELDDKIAILLNKICFDGEFLDKTLNFFVNNSNNNNNVNGNIARNFSSRGPSGPYFDQDTSYIPLEMAKTRTDKNRDNGRKSRNVSSRNVSNNEGISQRPSKTNLRSRNISTESFGGDEKLYPTSSYEKLHRYPEELPQKKSFREGIRNVFSSI